MPEAIDKILAIRQELRGGSVQSDGAGGAFLVWPNEGLDPKRDSAAAPTSSAHDSSCTSPCPYRALSLWPESRRTAEKLVLS